MFTFDDKLQISHIHCGADSGDLYVWGKNRSACLGLGHVLDQFFPYKVSIIGTDDILLVIFLTPSA